MSPVLQFQLDTVLISQCLRRIIFKNTRVTKHIYTCISPVSNFRAFLCLTKKYFLYLQSDPTALLDLEGPVSSLDNQRVVVVPRDDSPGKLHLRN
jgi:hypothetical protein